MPGLYRRRKRSIKPPGGVKTGSTCENESRGVLFAGSNTPGTMLRSRGMTPPEPIHHEKEPKIPRMQMGPTTRLSDSGRRRTETRGLSARNRATRVPFPAHGKQLRSTNSAPIELIALSEEPASVAVTLMARNSGRPDGPRAFLGRSRDTLLFCHRQQKGSLRLLVSHCWHRVMIRLLYVCDTSVEGSP